LLAIGSVVARTRGERLALPLPDNESRSVLSQNRVLLSFLTQGGGSSRRSRGGRDPPRALDGLRRRLVADRFVDHLA